MRGQYKNMPHITNQLRKDYTMNKEKTDIMDDALVPERLNNTMYCKRL